MSLTAYAPADAAPAFGSEADADTDADIEACRAAIRQGSRSFFAASLLLPAAVRRPAYALYAFCRLADDAVDRPDRQANALGMLRERLDRAYRGSPFDLPADRAFAAVVSGHAIPRAVPEALIEGLEWDAEGRRYEDIGDLRAYAARVAGTVGAMMTLLMGARAPATVARACDLGVAMQLTNIARDVGEDARAGRVYLPRRWLRDAGIDPEAFLAAPAFSPSLGTVVARLLAVADELYARSLPGITALPLACRPAIHAARLLYAEIGREVERNGLDSVSRRAVVPTGRKLRRLGPALAATLIPTDGHEAPALPETRFLVDAVAAAPSRSVASRPSRWDIDERVGWVLELFLELEQRKQLSRPR